MCRATSTATAAHTHSIAQKANANCATATIFADKYKTKFCRHYEEDASSPQGFSCKCPYKKKCLFAHTPNELRTKEMNMADGIFTKEDIRAWKKRVKKEAVAADAVYDDQEDALISHASQASVPDMKFNAPTPRSVSSQGCTNSGTQSPRFTPVECAVHQRPLSQLEVAQGFYTHDPYATASLGWEYNEACPCAQCSAAALYYSS